MRSLEYLVELRVDLRDELCHLKGDLALKRNEQKKLIENKKSLNDSVYKDKFIELSREISRLNTHSSIVIGQISMLNHVLNYDTPLVKGELQLVGGDFC